MGVMNDLEVLADKKFDRFEVVDIRQKESTYDGRIKIDDSETPIVFVRLEKGETVSVAGLKKDQKEDAEFCLDADTEMKDESQKDEPSGQPISGMVNQAEV